MTTEQQVELGREIYKRGGSYKSCKNAYTLRGYTDEERNTRCGYTLDHFHTDGHGFGKGLGKCVVRNSLPTMEECNTPFGEE